MTAENGHNDRAGMDGSTSRSLLAGAQKDDQSAWVRLVTLYAPLVAAWCRRLGVAEQDIVDVLQEVFAAVAGNLAGFRKERPHDTFRGWLSTIARNKVRDYYRRRAGRPTAAGGTEASRRLAEAPDEEATELDRTRADGQATGDDMSKRDLASCCMTGNAGDDSAEFGEVLGRALRLIRGDFQEQTWRAFWSVVVDGRATAEVALELGMQPGAVRVAKSRVLSRLRRELGDVPP
jgi:RNA polymerase sigma-70 factor (ECF subfamily)